MIPGNLHVKKVMICLEHVVLQYICDENVENVGRIKQQMLNHVSLFQASHVNLPLTRRTRKTCILTSSQSLGAHVRS